MPFKLAGKLSELTLTLTIDRPKLTLEEMKKLQQAAPNNKSRQ